MRDNLAVMHLVKFPSAERGMRPRRHRFAALTAAEIELVDQQVAARLLGASPGSMRPTPAIEPDA